MLRAVFKRQKAELRGKPGNGKKNGNKKKSRLSRFHGMLIYSALNIAVK